MISQLQQLISSNIKAVLWDMDGTLLNTEPLHGEALKKVAKDFKIQTQQTDQELYQLFHGKADHLIFDIVSTWSGFPASFTKAQFIDEKNKALMSLIQKTHKTKLLSPQIEASLLNLKNSGLTQAIVSSSEAAIIDFLLQQLELKDYFKLIISREDVVAVKPSPIPYLIAFEKLNIKPHEAIIIEDSIVGLKAAKDSECQNIITANWYLNA